MITVLLGNITKILEEAKKIKGPDDPHARRVLVAVCCCCCCCHSYSYSSFHSLFYIKLSSSKHLHIPTYIQIQGQALGVAALLAAVRSSSFGLSSALLEKAFRVAKVSLLFPSLSSLPLPHSPHIYTIEFIRNGQS